jgi:CubicO group peptidase (beta-lactamase class C family)
MRRNHSSTKNFVYLTYVKNFVICMSVLWASILATAMADDSPLFDVPRLSNINIDGNPADWEDSGFRVGVITSVEGEMLPAADFNSDFRLGWDERGLLLLLNVYDDVAVEEPDENSLWQRDSVELFIATKRGSSQYYQVVISPGMDSKYSALRKQINDHRADKSSPEELTVDAERSKTETGYILEVLLPWQNLALEPKVGNEIGFQLYVNDSDSTDDRFQTVWYPLASTHSDSSAMHRLRLANNPSPAVLVTAGGKYEQMRRIKINVSAVVELVGKEIEVRADDKVLPSGKLTAEEGRASASLFIPMPPRGKPYGELNVSIDNEYSTALNLPNPDEQRARALMDAELHFKPAVFSSAEFPACEFERPLWVEELIGPYEIKTTFYDRNYNIVTSAERPGRYGAIVEIFSEQGRVVRRFRTLFRQPENIQWWFYDLPISIELPKEFGIDPEVIAGQPKVIREHLKWRFVDGFYRDDGSAAMLAGLYETKPGSGEVGVSDDAWAKDRQWWVRLKRKFYEMDKVYPEPFVCPSPIEDNSATVLREGTPAEAGMKSDAPEQIDAVCQAWVADSDEPFAVCIARHGVIVLHKAYGQRDGKPMTVNDKSWMASITKLLSGTLMMMLVDQELVDLDDRVDKFIPALRSIEVKTPLTIRHLYTHTNGLWGHWGDDMHDFEELIADYYQYLQIGERHSYNGAGYALGGKVIETVTDEAIPQLYKKHLLNPLGCSNTDVTDTSGGSFSTPMDIAKIGQMLLNRGAYGRMRFFSEQTFEKMLPVRLTKLLGPETKIEWGIGATWFNDKGLGKGTFGHGAASAATLRIDRVNDLVIVMTRNRAGSNFSKYHPQFIAAIVDGLAE